MVFCLQTNRSVFSFELFTFVVVLFIQMGQPRTWFLDSRLWSQDSDSFDRIWIPGDNFHFCFYCWVFQRGRGVGGRVAVVQGLPCMFLTCLYPSSAIYNRWKWIRSSLLIEQPKRLEKNLKKIDRANEIQTFAITRRNALSNWARSTW